MRIMPALSCVSTNRNKQRPCRFVVLQSVLIDNLQCFAGMVQEDYHSHNPYHNAVHAADVTQAMYCYIKETKVNTLFSCHAHTAKLQLA